MRSLTVDARSRESAQALYEALLDFHAELLGDEDDGWRVKVELGGYDRQVLAVLEVIEEHVTERNTYARVELDGHRYTVHGDGAPSA